MNLTVTKTYNDWLVLLQDLVDGKLKLSPDQVRGLKQAAMDWPTCACGQVCNSLPRGFKGEPKDAYLYQQGLNFNTYIASEYWSGALGVFKNIEKRTTQLLLEQENVKKTLLEKRAQLDAELARLR